MKDCSKKAPNGCLNERSVEQNQCPIFRYHYNTDFRETGLIFKIFFSGLHLPFFDHPLTNKIAL